MKGFTNSTKTVSGHHFPGSPEHRFASGGIVPSMRVKADRVYEMHPVVPRPHVMPDMKKGSLPKGKIPTVKVPTVRRAAGGRALSPSVPYSEIEGEFPRREARPGYKNGGRPKMRLNIKKGALHKRLGIKGKIPTGVIEADKRKAQARGDGRAVKQDTLALNMRGWDHKAKGGGVSAPQARRIADQEVGKHVRSPKPAGHGVKGGGLGFMREPLCGGGRS